MNDKYMDKTVEKENVPLSERELKGGEPVFFFSSSVSAIVKDGSSHKMDSNEIDKAAIFLQNFKYWNQETEIQSINNLENPHFKEIVNMGVEAVPFIVEELKKGPTPLVSALDMIFPDVVKYEGFVSLKEACDKWISILQ